MNTLEDSLIRRLIMVASFIMFQPASLLDDRKQSGSIPFWLRFSMRLKTNLDADQLGLLAAGVAFYFLMAAFPALAVLVSLYALVADPVTMADQINLLGRFLPPDALAILTNQVTQLAGATDGSLSLSLLFSILFTFYAASKGMRVLIKGFNIAYNSQEKRNILLRNLLAYGLTIGMIVYMLVSLIIIAGIPALIRLLAFDDSIRNLLLWVRWPVLFGIALIGLEFLYTWGPAIPATTKRGWHWISIGSLTATGLWIGASSLFSLFVTHFGRYNETYGSLSAVVVLLLWFWLSAVMILLGAEINAAYDKERDI